MAGKCLNRLMAEVLMVLCFGVAVNAAEQADMGVVELKGITRTITVGGPEADIQGFTSRALQIAADALEKYGGGAIYMSSGTFEMTAPLRLSSDMAIIGNGEQTILRKCDGYSSPLALDAGYGMLQVTVKDASGFKPGMGIQIYDDASGRSWDATTARIVDIQGNTLYIDNFTRSDYKCDKNAVVSNACSVVEAVGAQRVRMANFVVDGNIAKNPDMLNGCIGGGIYLHKVAKALVRDVIVKDFNGDGISWQITEDVSVQFGQITGCSNFGLHPGTGSVRSHVEGCFSYKNNAVGLFVCWRVKSSKFINNTFYENGRDGISIGHQDTDNTFEGNFINENGRHGIAFRDEGELNGAHRNKFSNNIIQNNGTKELGYGIFINGVTNDIVIENNKIRDLDKGNQKVGVYINEKASNIKVENNQMEGHPDANVVEKTPPQETPKKST